MGLPPAYLDTEYCKGDEIMNKLFKLSLLLFVMSLLVGCSSTTLPGTFGAERKQFIILPENDYHIQAALDYGNMIGQLKQKGQLVENAQVRRVAQRLINQTNHYRIDAPNWNWQVNVIKNDSINAFAMPGGKIAVFTGMITKVKPTDDELAAVMGHEIAHALREHSREKASKAAAGRLTTKLVTSYAGLGEYGNLAVQLFEKYGWNLPNSRSAETEADLIGLELMSRAGYNPNAAVTLWQKVAAANNSNNGISFLSTHPGTENRIKKIQETSPRMMVYYDQSKQLK